MVEPCGRVIAAAVASAVSTTALAADPLAGASLYEDVRRYGAFGIHRYGSAGLDGALSWIADELTRAGLAATSQAFTIGRQYDFDRGSLAVGNECRPVMPHWWSPEDRAAFALTAPIARDGPDPAPGAFVRMSLPYDRGAYLNGQHLTALDAAFARRPAAVLLTIDHPSGEIFTYNVDQKQAAWPVPVILVAPRDAPLLDGAQRADEVVSVEVSGAYRRNVEGRNVVARLDRGKDKWIVVSTPVSSWFTSTCERGPGIAGFLAMARLSATRWPEANLVFVATAGHEVGHGGMEVFLQDGAPPPEKTVAWAHFGASLACFEWKRDGTGWVTARTADSRQRVILRSQEMEAVVGKTFAAVAGTTLTGEHAGVGELRDVSAAGYPRFFGIAGLHHFFHTPDDSAAATGPEILEPVVRAFAATLDDVAGSR